MPSELYVDNVNFNSINNSQISGFRNLIINGRFTINQRGAASKIATSNAYNYDRWYYKSDGKLYQGIENNNLVAGDSLTISWTSSTATAEYLFSNDSTANNGWDGSGTFTSVTNGGTFTVPSGLTTEHLWIRFTDAADTDFSELTKVQVEYGTKATMYEHRPISVELGLCQRYYEKSFNLSTAPANNTSETTVVYSHLQSGYGTVVPIVFKERKRAAGASTIVYNPYSTTANRAAWVASANEAFTHSTVGGITETGFYVVNYSSPLAAPDTTGNIIAFNWSAQSEL